MTAFLERPSSSATCDRSTSDAESPECIPGRRAEIGLYDSQELLGDVDVMISVPLASEVSVGIGKAFEKVVDRIEPDGGSAPSVCEKAPDLVDGHLPKPGPKRAFAPPIKAGDLADNDDEHFLSQVGGLIAEAGNAPEPALDHGQVDALQPVPVGGIRPGGLEPVEQANRGRVHERIPGRVLRSRLEGLCYPQARGKGSALRDGNEGIAPDEGPSFISAGCPRSWLLQFKGVRCA